MPAGDLLIDTASIIKRRAELQKKLDAEITAIQNRRAMAGFSLNEAEAGLAQTPFPELPTTQVPGDRGPAGIAIPSLLANLASVLSGNQRYGQEAQQFLGEERGAQREAKQASVGERRQGMILQHQENINMQRERISRAAKMYDELGDTEKAIKHGTMIQQLGKEEQRLFEAEMFNRNQLVKDRQLGQADRKLAMEELKTDAYVNELKKKAITQGDGLKPVELARSVHAAMAKLTGAKGKPIKNKVTVDRVKAELLYMRGKGETYNTWFTRIMSYTDIFGYKMTKADEDRIFDAAQSLFPERFAPQDTTTAEPTEEDGEPDYDAEAEEPDDQ
jgi:hypothetical protein